MKKTLFVDERTNWITALPRVTAAEIICGNCDQLYTDDGEPIITPTRTRRTTDGRCSACGGRSFVYASDLCRRLESTIRGRRQDATAVERIATSSGPDSGREVWGSRSAGEMDGERRAVVAERGTDPNCAGDTLVQIN